MNVLDANEIKYLRAELAARDAEIERLRDEAMRKTGARVTHQRPVLAYRVHENIYARLKESAAQNKLTISEEAARRVQRSFECEDASLGDVGE